MMKSLKPLDKLKASYLRKWVPLSVLVGIVAGLGAIIFDEAVTYATDFFLGFGAGYIPPSPPSPIVMLIERPYMIPLITTLGGLLSGIIVCKLAPEAEGHGTDAAIDSFHHKKGEIRSRIPLIKLIASAITIGSGGSAGKEGPAAQISAGFGSVISRLLRLNVYDRRIIMAAGIGAGIGAIFKAPFGGALLSSEILYKRDFEVEVLIPAFIASITGYSIFASVKGWSPIFVHVTTYTFTHPWELIFYAILGIICGLIGILYVKVFYKSKKIFKESKIWKILKPTLGGLLVGLIAMPLPQVLGTSYGWLQLAISGDFALLPIEIMFLLIFAKIMTTALTIGSGGSGGVFAPSLVIGGMIGGVTWYICRNLFYLFLLPAPSPAPFVIVGMMAFFGGVGKAPIAVILMVGEMTGTYTLLVPSIIATILAYRITGDLSIYESQISTRADSPVHRAGFSVSLLQKLKVRDAMKEDVLTVKPEEKVGDVAKMMVYRRIGGLPVVKEDKLIGIVTLSDVLQVPEEAREKTMIDEIMSKKLIVTYPDESLYHAFGKILGYEVGRLPVVDRAHPERLLGIITRGEIVRKHEMEVRLLLEGG
ncbi:MAG: chloride channel protein [Candidatus Methylarchaceae archaeon HK01B]|nr:chloride channel protein [Candidatus Methylarchaceae archaeon HK01M]MCP8311352.1 chloride channel protein [Candidatus Methylarchaceae archaeon HK02M1]MCP8318820.1 chloride channel protein [Candidatus Methylarchaceae archaeon HK01B]